jgi:hypothetical protein
MAARFSFVSYNSDVPDSTVVMYRTRILVVLYSNLGRDTRYPEGEFTKVVLGPSRKKYRII